MRNSAARTVEQIALSTRQNFVRVDCEEFPVFVVAVLRSFSTVIKVGSVLSGHSGLVSCKRI
jgi:hypothetical protein